jgi:hypothetical protein
VVRIRYIIPRIVIEKARSKEETLPSVRLFRAELDAIIKLFEEYCESVTLSDDEYSYEHGFKELRKRVGPRVRKFQIAGSKPSVFLTFDGFAIKLRAQYQDGGNTVDENKRTDHLFLRLREYLGEHRTLLAGLMNNTAMSILGAVATLLIGVSAATSPRPSNIDPGAIYLDLKHGLIFFGGFAILALIAVVGMQRAGHHFVYYGDSGDVISFWKRKKDDLFLGLIIAIVGAILGVCGTLVAQHFTK